MIKDIKYDINEKVYFMNENKISYESIYKILFYEDIVWYFFKDIDIGFHHSNLFNTKEELIDDLIQL